MGSNGLPPVRIPRKRPELGDPDYDEFRDYWWPKVLSECEEYERNLERRRFYRFQTQLLIALIVSTVIIVGGTIAVAINVDLQPVPTTNVPYTFK